jgi:holo-[acyl-carrier protein] synthase
MIIGMGIDVVDIDRFRHIVARRGDRFVERLFTKSELDYCRRKADSISSMAVRFAAKEAMIKALPAHVQSPFHWQDMETHNDVNGKPGVKVSGELKSHIESLKVHITLTHSTAFAAAVIILEKLEV